MIRDGKDDIYNPFAKKWREEAKRIRTTAKKNNNKKREEAACRHCGRMFEAKRGVKIHENKCKSAPPQDKTKKKAGRPKKTKTAAT